MQSIDMPPTASDLYLDDVYVWHRTETPIGERYEMRWTADLDRSYCGVVVREGPYYDAYIEVTEGERSTVHWAPAQFPTAGNARAWVQNHMLHE